MFKIYPPSQSMRGSEGASVDVTQDVLADK